MILDGVSYVDESRCCEISVETRFPLTHTGILSKSRVALGCERQRKTNTAPEYKMRSKGAYGFLTGHSGLIKTLRSKTVFLFLFLCLVYIWCGMDSEWCERVLNLIYSYQFHGKQPLVVLKQLSNIHTHKKKQRKIQPVQDPWRSLIDAASSHYMCPFAWPCKQVHLTTSN